MYEHQKGPALELKAALKKHKGAVGVAPPGSGKTVVGLNMIHELCPRRVIVVVDTDIVREQWIAGGHKFLGIKIQKLTFKKKIEQGVYVTTYSAMTKHPDIFHDCELLILDEADVAAAAKFVNCIFGTNFRLSLALTATPDRSDNLDVVYRMLAAPMEIKLGSNSQVPTILMRPYVHNRSFAEGMNDIEAPFVVPRIVAKSKTRNRWLAKQIYRVASRGRKVIGISKFINQLEQVQYYLDLDYGLKAMLFIGKKPGESKIDYGRKLALAAKSKIILATAKKGGRGLDIRDIDAGVMLLPILDSRQLIGRSMRPEGEQPVWLDPVDIGIGSMARQAYGRMHYYNTEDVNGRGWDVIQEFTDDQIKWIPKKKKVMKNGDTK